VDFVTVTGFRGFRGFREFRFLGRPVLLSVSGDVAICCV